MKDESALREELRDISQVESKIGKYKKQAKEIKI